VQLKLLAAASASDLVLKRAFVLLLSVFCEQPMMSGEIKASETSSLCAKVSIVQLRFNYSQLS